MANPLHLLAGFDSIRLGWSLIHLLWQGVVIVFLLEIALLIAGRRNASLRYVLCALALVALPVCLVDTYLFLGSKAAVAATPLAPATMTAPHVAASPVTAAHFTWQPVVSSIADFTSRQMSSFDLNQWLPGIVLAWLGGVVLLAVRKAGGFIVLSHWRWHEVYAPNEAMCELCREACAKIGVDPHRVYLGISNLIEIPMTMGWLRPVILFPVNLLTGLSIEEIELLLAHELAHIRRCDYLVNLVQIAVETIFFYHPVTWWISRRMRQERENSCDDLVAARSQDIAAYAHALFRLETLRLSPGFTLALAATGGSLLQRIQRLADKPLRKSGTGFVSSLVLSCLLGAFLVAWTSGKHPDLSWKHLTGWKSGSPFAGDMSPNSSLLLKDTLYQDNFDRRGELDGSSPGVVNKTGATWKSSTGEHQYQTSGHAAELNSSAYAYSLAYLPVNGTSGIKLDGSRDFALSVVVNPGPSGRTGISLNTGTLERYSNLFSHTFAALTTCRDYAGAFTFNEQNIQYSYAPGARGPTRVSLTYSASARTVTYRIGTNVIHLQTGVMPQQVADIRWIGLGNDGFNAGFPPSKSGPTAPAPMFSNFRFTERGLTGDDSALASTP